MMKSTRIVIVDDHHLVRAGLREMLSDQPDLDIVGEFDSGRDALQALSTGLDCNLVLLDLSLPKESGLDVLRTLRADHAALRTLIVSAHSASQFGLNVLRSGANGYINKDADAPELLRAIRQIARGGRYVSPELASLLVDDRTSEQAGPLHSLLSERELQIFVKLANGTSVTQIAHALAISVKTVSTYRTRILEKMSLGTNADIVRYAIANGLRSDDFVTTRATGTPSEA